MFALEDRYWWFVARRRLAWRLIERFPCVTNSDRVKALDLGCGTGAMLSDLRQRFDATGVDVSPDALDFCRSRGLEGLVEASAEALPFADSSFDLVVSLDVLEHVQDDHAAAAEIARTLKPGGRVVVNVPAFRWLWGPHDVALHHHRRYKRAEIVGLLESQGLQVVWSSYSVFLLFPLVALRRMAERMQSGPAEVRLPAVPAWLNRFLIRLMDFEAWLLLRLPLPWGSSVVVVAEKPR